MECELVYSESTYLEILPRNVSKGNALARLLDYIGAADHYTIAVGDNLNDLTMIQSVHKGIAVGNAHPELKQAASEVTVNHEMNALSKVIYQLLKGGTHF